MKPKGLDSARATIPKNMSEERLLYFIAQIKTKEIKPEGFGSSRVTILKNKNEGLQFLFETPQDAAPISNAGMTLPLGDGSVHRFAGSGTVQFKTQAGTVYTFISEGDSLHRLTFILTQEHGYVYLRGKGRVAPEGGTEVKLGY